MHSWFRKTFRITQWLPNYQRGEFWGDVKAGLTCGTMLIPQGMAYAVIAGMPPIYGLYAGVIPLLVYPLLGTSRHLSIGPVAVDMLIVGAGVSAVAATSGNFISLVILLTMMTGILQLLLGIFRLGALFNFFSRPVIAGFTMAAPIIIAFTQLDNLTGMPLPDTQYIVLIMQDIFQNLHAIHLPSLYWGLAAIVLLVLMQRFAPALPAAVLVLAAGIGMAWLVPISSYGIEIVGAIPGGLPSPALPDLSLGDMRRLLPTALTLALVQFMSIASLGKAFAKRHDYLIDSNHELIAVGAANLTGSFFNSLPVSGSFSRSAAAEQAGVRTPLANIFTAALLVLTLLFLTDLFFYLPMPILAAIIMVAVSGLIDIQEIKFLFTAKTSDGLIATFTFFATLFIGIQEGILLGVGASIITLLYKYSRPAVAELGMIPETRVFKNIKRHPEADRLPGLLILRVDASFSFINADFFRDFIIEKSSQEHDKARFVIIDGSGINTLDTTATDTLTSINKTLAGWDMELYLTGLKGPVLDVIRKSGLRETIGAAHYCDNTHEAVKQTLQRLDAEDNGHRYNTYAQRVD